MHDRQTHIVRRNLAYFWSVVAAGFLFYAAVAWGGIADVRALLIGFVLGSGITGTIIGTYFSATVGKNETIQQTADNITNSPAISQTPDAADNRQP